MNRAYRFWMVVVRYKRRIGLGVAGAAVVALVVVLLAWRNPPECVPVGGQPPMPPLRLGDEEPGDDSVGVTFHIDPQTLAALRRRSVIPPTPDESAATLAALDEKHRSDPASPAALAARVEWFLQQPPNRPSQPRARVFKDGGVTALAFSQDGSHLAGADSVSVRLWDAVTGKLTTTLGGLASPVVQIAFSQDGKRVRVRDESGGLWEWIVGEAKARRLDLNGGTCLAISQEGERVVSSHATNRNALGAAVGGPPAANREAVRLVVWDLGIDAVRPTPLAAFARHSAPVRQVTFVAEGRIRSSDPQTGSFLWDAGTGLTVSSGGERVEPGLPTAISSDGRTYLATSNLLRPIRAIDAPGGAGEKEWPLPGRVVSLAVSPCGEQVLAGFAKSVVVVHADSAEPVDFLESPTDLGAGLVVSPDGRFAAAPSSEGPVLWRLPPTPGQAVADAERLTRADPCSAPYRVLQGLCHLRAGSPDRAKADIEEALFLDPDSAEAHFQDALLRIERGEALGPSVERAVALDPKVAEALFLSGVTRAEIGLALGKQEDLVKAKADLSRAFELKPELRDLPLVRQGQDRP